MFIVLEGRCFIDSDDFKNSFLPWQYTQDEAQKLGVRGWCMNTYHGTVAGQLEGPQDKVKAMYVSTVLCVYCVGHKLDIYFVVFDCASMRMHCAGALF